MREAYRPVQSCSMTTFNPSKILVPVALDPDDTDAFAEQIVDIAADLAKPFQANLVLLHLETILNPGETASVHPTGEIYKENIQFLQRRMARGHARMAVLQERAQEKGLHVEIDLREGDEDAAVSICDVAKDMGAHLIVIGSHGRRGVKRLLLSSVAEKVAHLAPCPVLLVRPS